MIPETNKLLNPTLFKALRRRFNRVKVISQGIPMRYRVIDRSLPGDNGQKTIVIDQWGESYRVCCPKCSDQRFRLLVNHRHQTIEPVHGIRFGNKVRCFNETHCNHRDFDDTYLKPYIYRNQKIPESAAGEPDLTLGPAPSPGRCAKLTALPPNGAVWSYLRNRTGGGFDPQMLEEQYDVCYCFDAADEYPMMNNRLVIPVYYNKVAVGWQGRAIDDTSGPKYFTLPGFPKSQVLFNFDRAEHKPVVVVTEGVFDAIRVGDCGVCIFGHMIAHHQTQLLTHIWKRGALVMLLDPDDRDAQQQAQAFVNKCQDKFRNGAANVVLPSGMDPADMSHEDLWKEIYRQCTQQQVRLHQID